MHGNPIRRFIWLLRLCFATQSLIFGFGLLFALGCIPEWGHWYSDSPFYSAQINSILHGSLALSHSLKDVDHDLVWANGGVQQVWGLGVPILRLPLSLIGSLFGCTVFPEHIATGILLSFVAYLLLVLLVEPPIINGESYSMIFRASIAVAFLLLFPPFLGLFKTRFWVYEETAAYTYLFGILEAALVFQFLRKPSKLLWFALMFVAGFGAFVRPTLVFYGFATWFVSALASPFSKTPPSRQHPDWVANHAKFHGSVRRPPYVVRSWITDRAKSVTWLGGSFLFSLGIVALLYTNWLRFGSPIEFGHKLNVQLEICDGSLYATRFDHPFQTEPFPTVAKELLGALFWQKKYQFTEDYYSSNPQFWGQASAPRMREIYFKTYDWTYAVPLALVILMTIRWFYQLFRGKRQCLETVRMKVAAWCLLSIIPIFWFYLRTPALCSRYLLDFAPAFAVMVLLCFDVIEKRLGNGWGMRSLVIFGIGVWMSCEMITGRAGAVNPDSLTWNELSWRHNFGTDLPGGHPFDVGDQTTKSGESGIPYDGIGWSHKSGSVMPLAIVFVEDAQFLELVVSRSADSNEAPNPEWVRAKIGLEFLERESITREGNDWRILFRGPKQPSYRKSIQPAFIAFVPSARLADKTTPWVLNLVRWREQNIIE